MFMEVLKRVGVIERKGKRWKMIMEDVTRAGKRER